MTTRTEVKMKNQNVNQNQINLYKGYFILNEFNKELKSRLYVELDEGHFFFTKVVNTYDLIKEFSGYGDDLINLDFEEYLYGEECFFCYIDFDVEGYYDLTYQLFKEDIIY